MMVMRMESNKVNVGCLIGARPLNNLIMTMNSKVKGMNKNGDYPTHVYILWKTGEVLGFTMKEATQKMGIGSTSFKTQMRNRFVTKVSVVELTNKLKVAKGTGCLSKINSENYDCSEQETIKQ